MPKLDRYLSAEFARAVFAALVILGMVSLGGLFADLIGEFRRERSFTNPCGIGLHDAYYRIDVSWAKTGAVTGIAGYCIG